MTALLVVAGVVTYLAVCCLLGAVLRFGDVAPPAARRPHLVAAARSPLDPPDALVARAQAARDRIRSERSSTAPGAGDRLTP